MNDTDERLVPNPYVQALEQLKARVESAVAETPPMEAPTAAIGDGTAWTGSFARQTHDDYLAPNASAVSAALGELVGDVDERKADHEPMVSEDVAEAIRIELGWQ